MTKSPRVVAHYELRVDGWIVTARAGEGEVVAHGRTLGKARENIADQLAATLKTYAGHIVIDDSIDIAASATKAVQIARAAKDRALKAAAESSTATAAAARQLEREGLSLRDIAYVLGISHSRVHQVLGHADTTEGKDSP